MGRGTYLTPRFFTSSLFDVTRPAPPKYLRHSATNSRYEVSHCCIPTISLASASRSKRSRARSTARRSAYGGISGHVVSELCVCGASTRRQLGNASGARFGSGRSHEQIAAAMHRTRICTAQLALPDRVSDSGLTLVSRIDHAQSGIKRDSMDWWCVRRKPVPVWRSRAGVRIRCRHCAARHVRAGVP